MSVWTNAEIGYALGLRIPILPIGIGKDPAGMIQSVQSVTLLTDPINHRRFQSEVTKKLTCSLIEQTSKRGAVEPALFECTEDNIRRATLLANYARSVKSIGRHGLVRQKASLTSFHLPGRPATDRIWKTYFGVPAQDNRSLYDSLREERDGLENHARFEGCKRIINSIEVCKNVYERYGRQSAAARVRGLLEFLEDRDVRDVQVAVNSDRERRSSMTIVGDWFSSEAISSKETPNLREAIFTRHAATVRRQIEDFDREFKDLLRARKWTPMQSGKNAIHYLKKHLRHLDGTK